MKMNLKKTWENEYAHFKYYELWDILPAIVDLCKKYNLFTKISFNNEVAELIIFDAEEDWSYVSYTSPMRELELKWCNQIQALGWIETYQRRYLYMNAFDIVEQDMFDATSWKEEEKKADDKPWFNKEQLDMFCSIANKYKDADEALKVIRTKYKVSKQYEGEVKKLYDNLKVINS